MSERGVLAGRRMALFLITTIELVVFLDTTVVNIALPAIGRGLRLSEAGLGWVTNAYVLAFGGFMLVGGRAADLLGPRRVFGAGLALFTLGSALAGLAPTAWLLIAARALQGIGGAVVVPAQIALLKVTFPEPAAHRRAFGVWSAMGATGAAIGTTAGGLLTQGLGWPSIFLINLPIGAVALALIGRLLPADPPRTASVTGRLDLTGALVGTSALLLLGYAIGALADAGTRGPAWVLLAAGSLLLAAFVFVESRAARPLMPLRLFRVRAVTGSTIVNVLLGAAHMPAFVLLTLFLQNGRHYSPTRSGLAVLPVALVSMVASRTFIPYLLKRIGASGSLALGLGLQVAVLGWFTTLDIDGSYVTEVLPAALVFGVGLPLAFVGVTVPAVTAVREADTGIAAGIVNTGQRVGAGLGVTVLLLIASTVTAHATGTSSAALAAGIHAGFAAAAGLAALGCVITLLMLRTRATSGDGGPAGSAPGASASGADEPDGEPSGAEPAGSGTAGSAQSTPGRR